MSSSFSSRRAGYAGLAVTLAAGALLAAPLPAQAGVLDTPLHEAVVQFDDNPPTGACTLSGPGDVINAGPFAADGVPVTRTATSSATDTRVGNPSDVTTLTGSATSTVTANQAAGQLTHVSVTSSFTSTVTTAIASQQCDADVTAGSEQVYTFDLVTPKLLTVSVDSHHMIGVIEAGNILGPLGSGEQSAAVVEAIGPHAHGSSSVVLPAGTGYFALTESINDLVAPATAGTVSASGDAAIDLSFSTPGVASVGQTGAGGQYLTLDSARNCAAGTVGAAWSGKAGKGKNRTINKATVKVNGLKLATFKKPTKNTVSTITGLDSEKAAEVQVVLRVKVKGQRIVQRSYLTCT
jgi:hypothetical protein